MTNVLNQSQPDQASLESLYGQVAIIDLVILL